jgi:hypothetical protein
MFSSEILLSTCKSSWRHNPKEHRQADVLAHLTQLEANLEIIPLEPSFLYTKI